MSLRGDVMTEDSSLNSFEFIGSIQFIPGENLVFKFRIIDPEDELRYIPPATTIVTVTLNTTEGELEKTGTMLADDRSMVTVELSQAETDILIGGNIFFELDEEGDGSFIRKGIIANGLSKITGAC